MTTISTANLGFFDEGEIAESVNSDYNIERQPEIAIWPPKPEIVIPLELQQTASKFQRQVHYFWPRRAKWLRQWSTTENDNVATKTGNTYISGTTTDRITIPTANMGFSTTPSSKTLTRATATTTVNRKWQYRRFARQSYNFWQSVVVAIIWLIFCRAGHHRKSRIWR